MLTQTEKVIDYLRGTGKELTSTQAKTMWGVSNLRARMSEIRKKGLKVRTRLNHDGVTAYKISARDIAGSRAQID